MSNTVVANTKAFFKNFKFNKGVMKKIVIALIILAILVSGFFVYKAIKAKSSKSANSQTVTAKVTKGLLQVKIEGSGSCEPIERYDIMPLVKGTILEAPLEEGDAVSEGDLLYKIDSTDILTNIEKTNNSLEKLYNAQADLNESIKNLTVLYQFLITVE